VTNVWTQTTKEGREWKRKYDQDHYQQQREERRVRAIGRRRNKRAWLLVDAARRRARIGGLSFDLDEHRQELQERIDAGFCEVTGIPFNLDGGRTYDSPSLDRINPRRGYTYDNVRMVCDLMNRAMSDWGEEPVRIVMSKWLSSCQSPQSS
jgi:hypothetical protein